MQKIISFISDLLYDFILTPIFFTWFFIMFFSIYTFYGQNQAGIFTLNTIEKLKAKIKKWEEEDLIEEIKN